MDILRATKQISSHPRSWGSAAIAGGVTRISRALTRVVGLIWALTMSVAGGLMMLGASEVAPWLTTTLVFAGLTGIVAGVFVFQVVVADRLFPDVYPRLIRNVEAVLGVGLMIGIVLTTLTLLL